jgi:hypothetical protein
MPSSLVNYVLFFGGIGLLCFIMLKLGHYYWSYRLNQWAVDQGLKLVDFRGAKFYEGPSAWIRSDRNVVAAKEAWALTRIGAILTGVVLVVFLFRDLGVFLSCPFLSLPQQIF